MATRALDIVTVLHALKLLQEEIRAHNWYARNQQQIQVLTWLKQHGRDLKQITGIDAKASNLFEALNTFLVDRHFEPIVQPFDPTYGIGVVSVLDKLVTWLNGPADRVEIVTQRGKHPGFELPENGVRVYTVSGYDASAHLIEILTTSKDTLWLFDHDDHSLEDLDLIRLAMDVMRQERVIPRRTYLWGTGDYSVYAGAHIPMIDFSVTPDVSWLVGAEAVCDAGEYFKIFQAHQHVKMRMDETGARVKAATAVVAMRGISEEPAKYILNRPFYGWWTRKGLEELPMAAFFADWDAMHQPSGSLADL